MKSDINSRDDLKLEIINNKKTKQNGIKVTQGQHTQSRALKLTD